MMQVAVWDEEAGFESKGRLSHGIETYHGWINMALNAVFVGRNYVTCKLDS